MSSCKELLCSENAPPDYNTPREPIFDDMKNHSPEKDKIYMDQMAFTQCLFLAAGCFKNQYARKTVVSWMMEVCEDQHCSACVCALAVNLFDRYLGKFPQTKCNYLQTIACACILTASECKDGVAVTLLHLQNYTDDSVKIAEIKIAQLNLVQCVEWDIDVYLPNHFVSRILSQFTDIHYEILNIVKHGAECLLAMTLLVNEFSTVEPSVQALAATVLSITLQFPKFQTHTIKKLQDIIPFDNNLLVHCFRLFSQLSSNYCLPLQNQIFNYDRRKLEEIHSPKTFNHFENSPISSAGDEFPYDIESPLDIQRLCDSAISQCLVHVYKPMDDFEMDIDMEDAYSLVSTSSDSHELDKTLTQSIANLKRNQGLQNSPIDFSCTDSGHGSCSTIESPMDVNIYL